MTDLPEGRVVGDLPVFNSCGVDIFGPFHTRFRRGTIKRYGVIFVCIKSRAVHLELASDLSTDSLIQALIRFKSRRGNVRYIYSDNGTNLVGANNVLQKIWASVDTNQVTNRLMHYSIEWRFHTPTARHHGGFYERLIRLVKQVLTCVLWEQPCKLTDESLHTLKCEVEFIVSNRPIAPISSEPHDLGALTPNHLLLKSGVELFPHDIFSEKEVYAVRRWRQTQYLVQIFWKKMV